MTVEFEVAAWESRGRRFTAAGVGSFVVEEGEGDPVVCMHGVPVSAYLYRKVLPELAARGMRGVAFDLPGLGLAERPRDFDYTWTGLGRWALAAVDALGLERFHLVVHDLGGPAGLEVAAAIPDRIASLTLLNTLVEVGSFTKPWVMRPFGVRGLGEAWLATVRMPVFRMLMALQGVHDRSAITTDELGAHLSLLRRGDDGAAFLRIMRGFEATHVKQLLYVGALRAGDYPRQVVWGENDPALRIDTLGEQARRAAGVDSILRLPGKHFLQEDNAPAIAEAVATLARG